MPTKQFYMSASRTPPKGMGEVQIGTLCRIVDKGSAYHNAIVAKYYSGLVGLWFPKKASSNLPFESTWDSSDFKLAELSLKEKIVVTSAHPTNGSPIPMCNLKVGQVGVIDWPNDCYHGTIVVGIYGGSTISIYGHKPFWAEWSHPNRNIVVIPFQKGEAVDLRQLS